MVIVGRSVGRAKKSRLRQRNQLRKSGSIRRLGCDLAIKSTGMSSRAARLCCLEIVLMVCSWTFVGVRFRKVQRVVALPRLHGNSLKEKYQPLLGCSETGESYGNLGKAHRFGTKKPVYINSSR